jgi:MoxR-like ATPase
MLTRFLEQMNTYFAGKGEIVEDVLCCFLAGGHVLLEDVPGVGKTTLARTFAGSLGLSFGRIQFTPDTMPGDVTGLSVYNMKTGEFTYREGAVMRNILLADELNRTSPKTQAALLEAMAESQVTVDGTKYPLPQPFMVIATQNPVSFTGTFPLPEAQLDRFMMRLSIGYPSEEEELRLARSFMEGRYEEEIRPVLELKDVLELKEKVNRVHISDAVMGYVQQIIARTRAGNGFSLGASPRALLQLLKAAQAKAFLDGRDFVKPDDVKKTVKNVLSHRLIPTTEMKLQKKKAEDLLDLMLLKISVPVE